jgi:hypothetical protein
LSGDQARRSQPLAAVPGDRHLIEKASDVTTDGSANCEILPDRVTDCRWRQWLHVNESNPKLLDLQSAFAEMQRSREENARLRCLLQEHGMQIPAAQSIAVTPVTTNALPSSHIPGLKAEQRIALFRSLFHKREMFMQFAGRTPTGGLVTYPRQIVTGRPIFAPKTRTEGRLTARLGSSDR